MDLDKLSQNHIFFLERQEGIQVLEISWKKISGNLNVDSQSQISSSDRSSFKVILISITKGTLKIVGRKSISKVCGRIDFKQIVITHILYQRP